MNMLFNNNNNNNNSSNNNNNKHVQRRGVRGYQDVESEGKNCVSYWSIKNN
jgi:hypothetical protein